MNKNKHNFGLIAFLLLLPSLAQAVVVSDTFETYTVGTSPAGFNGWTEANIINTPPVQNALVETIADRFDNAANRAVRIIDNNTTAVPGPVLTNTFAAQDSNIIVRFDARLTTQNQNPTFRLRNGTTDVIVLTLAQTALGFQVSYQDNTATFNPLLAPLNFGGGFQDWYTFEIIATDLSTTWGLNVRDFSGATVLSTTGLSYRNIQTQVTSTGFFFNAAASASGGNYLIDNFVVIPEPSQYVMWSLFLLGLFCVIFRKRFSSRANLFS